MSIIISITLVNTRDLAHCEAWALLPYIWEQKDSFPGGGLFLTGLWKFILNYFCVDVVPGNAWALGEVTLWLFSIGVSNDWALSSTATFAIEFWSFFELFVYSFSMVSAGFLCTATVLVDYVL